MARAIPLRTWLDITRTAGTLSTDIANYAARYNKPGVQRQHRELTSNFLDRVEADMPPDQVAVEFRKYIEDSKVLMGASWWAEIKATTQGALIRTSEGLDVVGERFEAAATVAKEAALKAAAAAKAAGKTAAEAAAAASEAAGKALAKIPAFVGKTLAQLIGPLFPYLLIAGGVGLVVLLMYMRVPRLPKPEKT